MAASTTTTNAAPAPPSTGSVKGTITLLSSCGAVPAGGTCPPQPMVGAEVDATQAGGIIVASGKSAGDGSYSLPLPPGGYTLIVAASSQASSPYPQCPQKAGTIASSAIVTADIACSTPTPVA